MKRLPGITNIPFITDTFYRVRGFFRNLIQGTKNFWFYRKVIYSDRWWDYSFFLDILERKLQNLDENWDRSIAYFKDDVHGEIKNLLETIRELKHYENQTDNLDATSEFPYLDHLSCENKIDYLYDKIGQSLFSIREFSIKTISQRGDHDVIQETGTYKTTFFRLMWD